MQNRIVVDLTYKKILSEIKEEKKRNLSVMVWKTNQIDIPIMNIFSVLFWWNPMVYLLEKNWIKLQRYVVILRL